MRRSAILASLAAVVALAMLPAAASAHAQLLGTSPQRGADLKRQPAAVVFRFNEAVEGNFGAVRVFDATGRRVDSGDAFHPGGTGRLLGVHLRAHLPQGTYTATYRVISADGHPVSSGIVFTVGRAGAAPQKSVSQLLGSQRSGTATDVMFGVARALQYGAVALAVGGMAFLLLVWLPGLRLAAGAGGQWRAASEAFARRHRRLVFGAVIVGALSAALGIVMQGATAAGISGWSALRPHVVREVLGTRFGTAWGLGVLAWLLVGAALPVALGRARAPVAALRTAELGATGLAAPALRAPARLAPVTVPLVYLLWVPVLAGHASTQSPTGLLVPSVLAHVGAMAIWAGGLTMLVAALPVATRRLESDQRGVALAAMLSRFSPIALACVIVIVASGVTQAIVEVRTFGNLLSTAFGRAVLIKIVLLVGLIGLGAYNRRRSVPALQRIAAGHEPPGRTGLMLRRALRAEVALIVVVLGVTAALASYAPSIAVQSGPYSKTTRVGPAELQMTVDPARVGANEVHLYLLRPKDGAPYTGAKELDLAATLPAKRIGPLDFQAQRAGPGHYIAPSAVLNVPGSWRLQITLRVNEFDEYLTTVKVPVR